MLRRSDKKEEMNERNGREWLDGDGIYERIKKERGIIYVGEMKGNEGWVRVNVGEMKNKIQCDERKLMVTQNKERQEEVQKDSGEGKEQ